MKTLARSCLLLFVALLSGAPALHAQAGAPDTTQNGALRAFLDCDQSGCDRAFIVTEMGWVNWMRDRLDADFHILVTAQATGSGGRRYDVVAIGQRAFVGKVDTIAVTTDPNDAADVVRRALVRVIGQLLVARAGGGVLGPHLTIAYAAPAGIAPARDAWDFWTFRVSANGAFNGESRQRFRNFSGGVQADRTTADWKIRSGASVSYYESTFTLTTGTDFTALQRRASGDALVVRSLGEHWSAGGGLSVAREDYGNLDLSTEVAAAVEWDFFPYRDFVRKRFTVLYYAGLRSNRYQAITIYDRLRETRPLHTLEVTFGARQPWGEAGVAFSGEQYLDRLAYYRAGLNAWANIRLGKGFSFELGGGASRVRNQISLPRAGLTDEAIIARLQALQTDYRYFMNGGISYRFGSIFNSIVNPRFGAVDFD